MRLYSNSEHTPPARILHVISLLIALLAGGCVAVKDPPAGKPYVFENKVTLRDTATSKERLAILSSRLPDYLADSQKVPTKSVIGFTQRVSPPAFDSGNVLASLRFMNGYLQSEGFYNARLDTFTVRFDSISRKKRFFSFKKYPVVEVKTHFYLSLGKSLRIDSIRNDFANPGLQRLADSARATSPLAKNTPYSKQAVAVELERLSSIFRNNGYMKMSRAALLAEVDTADLSLVSFLDDPVQQQLAALRRQQDPTAWIRIYQRPGTDSTAFLQYRIDSVYLYPDTRLADNPDSLIRFTGFQTLTNKTAVVIREREHLFQEKMLRRNNHLLPGSLYNERNYFRTVNAFTQMGPWQQGDVRTITHADSVPGAVFHMFLYPAKKQSLQIDLEGSQNNNISVSNVMSGRFLAVGVASTYRSRNVLKKGTQSTTTIRTGLEINNNASSGNEGIFQSFLLSGNQTFSIPRLVWPWRFLDNRGLDYRRTAINLGGLYTDRFEFFKQTSINANLQWDIRKDKNIFSFSFPTFETVDTVSTDSLYKEIQENPELAYSFTPGNVLSVRGSWERGLTYANNRHFGFFRTAAEITLPGDFQLFGKDFFKFFRLEGQFIHHVKFNKHSFDMRFYGGVGWDLSGKANATMPYFRQFVAGGSNSMRAWSIRQLGLGNSLASDTAVFTDRFGDIQLELNLEYRMRLARMFGYNLDGAVLLDIGNIWNHKPASDGLGDFQLRYLYRDLAMSLGYGVRWDLSFLVIRFDGGFKLKDPVRAGNGWLDTFEWSSTNRLGTNKRSNVAIQFGIGYPF